MPKYLVLLAGSETEWNDAEQADRDRWMRDHVTFAHEVGSGILAGEALDESATATTLRRRTGRVELTDGPYAETTEQLGGFYLIEAGNLDQVVEWCALLPEIYSIEIRPVIHVELPD